MQLASAAESRKDWKNAKEHFDAALKLKPNDPVASEGLKRAGYNDAMRRAEAAIMMFGWAEARAAYREALGYRPNDPTATGKLQEILYKR
jgi:tetratricopeptide (TPR) repeat protein